MNLAKKFGMAGMGTSLVVAGALLCGGSAGAAALDDDASARVAAGGSATLGPAVTVQPNSNSQATVNCPAGKSASGGGLITSSIRLFVTDSFKTSTGGWAVRVTNTDSSAAFVMAEAVCT